jgi:succinate dehydrogenase / fumarate reductase cytochrome b subunit
MSSLIMTVRESIRYRGRSGQYSWLAHRLSGLAILSFLVIHVWDTANAHFLPGLYQWSILMFKHPVFLVGEVGIMAAVLYHAFNGIRVSLLDFKPEWWKYQGRSATLVWGLFLVIFVPIAIYMASEGLHHCQVVGEAGGSCWALPSLNDFRPFSEVHPVIAPGA